MLEYYRVLNNAWKTEIRNATRLAIQMLSDMPRVEKLNKDSIDKLMGIINTQFGDNFAALVNEPTKAIIDRCVRLGLKDSKGKSFADPIHYCRMVTAFALTIDLQTWIDQIIGNVIQ